MELFLEKDELKYYLERQMENYFPDNLTEKYFRGADVNYALDEALIRLENCFKHINNPVYSNEKGQTFFSHLHSDQYSQFLYFFMNSLWKKSQNKVICDKTLLLNKLLNNLFVSYKCELPDIFLFAHPVGTIIGNAKYSDYLVVFQNVTVNTGEGRSCLSPVLGKGLMLAAGAKIIGNESIGDRVIIGVDAVVYKQSINNDKMVIRNKLGEIEIKENTNCIQQNFFRTQII